MLRVEHLVKSYGSLRAVDQVSFFIQKGEVVGFLGPNGAGKTTTMKILTGYLLPDEGRVEVAGYDVVNHPLDVKRHIGYLPESTPLYPEMWVYDYLNFVGEVREMPQKHRPAAIDRVVQICSLAEVLYKTIGELSKGYRQRVGLAQAIIHDPQVLVLDEPTVGLDPNQIHDFRGMIRRLGAEKTVILSTHVLSEVEATCARALMIHRGAIVKDATLAEIAAQGRSLETVFRELTKDAKS